MTELATFSGISLLSGVLKDQEKSVGDDISFTCAVRNPGQTEIRWLKKQNGGSSERGKNVVKLNDGFFYKVSLISLSGYFTNLS